ncbi:MAG: NifU N-terminal domain-containing protein [Phycisphaerales bacterium]
MPLEIASFESTPNPNAVKCVLAGEALPPGAANVSARTPEEAGVHALAAALFALDGVTGVLITRAWLTVNKSPDAEWKSLKAKIKRAVAQAPSASEGGDG